MKIFTMEELVAEFYDHLKRGTSPSLEEVNQIVLHLQEAAYYRTQAEQLQTQLAGCSAAALGWTKEPLKRGDYGWSPAYKNVLELRKKYEEQVKRVAALEKDDALVKAATALHNANTFAEWYEARKALGDLLGK